MIENRKDTIVNFGLKLFTGSGLRVVLRKGIVIIILLLNIISVRAQSVYFVSNDGNDENDGLSQSSPWKSISKVNSQNFMPGDSILFRRGDTWREELVIRNSGSLGNNIVFSAYGEGERPKILGSAQCENFIGTETNNVWQSTSQVDNPGTGYAGGVYIELSDTSYMARSQKEYDPSFSNLKEELDWCWHNGNIFLYSNHSPNSFYKSVEVAQRDHSIRLANPNPDYITIDGVQTSYAKRRIIYCEYPAEEAYGLEIRNCEISYGGIRNGMSAYGIFTFYSDLIIENNIIHDCGRRGISYTVYETRNISLSNVHVRNNIFYNGYHSTSIDCQVGTGGLEPGDTLTGFYFYNNFIFNDPEETLIAPEGYPSNDVFFQVEDTVGGKTSYVSGVYIYNNIIVNSKSRAILVNYCDSVFCWNNTIYGSSQAERPSEGNIWAMVAFRCTRAIDFRNNIIYGNVDNEITPATCLLAEENDLNTYKPKFIAFDNNLFFHTDSNDQRIIHYRDMIEGGHVKMHDVGDGDQGWDTYIANNPNQNQNSPVPSDPLFVDPVNYNFRLSENSPARGKGVNIPLITHDYYGNTVNTPPDIGAIQYKVGDDGPPGSNGQLIIKPNPVFNSSFELELKEESQTTNFYVRIYNIKAVLVFESEKFTGNSKTFKNFHLPSGVYIVEVVINDSKSIKEKIIFIE